MKQFSTFIAGKEQTNQVSTALFQWLKKNITLLFNAGSLLGTTVVTSGLGFVYWLVAARLFSQHANGVSGTTISDMMLIGNICLLGLSTLLLTEIPRKPELAPTLISTSLLVVGSLGFVAGLGFSFLIPIISPDLHSLNANFGNSLIFAAGVGLTAISLVLDQAFIALLRGDLQLWRNSSFAAIKLVALVLVRLLAPEKNDMLIYATWALGNVLSFFLLLRAIKPGKFPFRAYLPRWTLVRKMSLTALRHHLLNMALLAPTLILPQLVTSLLGAGVDASFYISWMLASFIFMVPYALTTVLHATNAAHPQAVGQKMRMTMGLATAASLAATLVIWAVPELILGIIKPEYIGAAWCLRILALASFPLVIKNHYISICRIQDRLTSAMIGMAPGGLLELILAAVGAHFAGLTGLSLGWLSAVSIQAIFMVPTLLRAFRPIEEIPLQATISLEESDMDPIWLIDTALMPAVGTSYSGLETTWQLRSGKIQAIRLATGEMLAVKSIPGSKRLTPLPATIPPVGKAPGLKQFTGIMPATPQPLPRSTGEFLTLKQFTGIMPAATQPTPHPTGEIQTFKQFTGIMPAAVQPEPHPGSESGIKPSLKRTQLTRQLPALTDTYQQRAILVPPALSLPSRPSSDQDSRADLNIVGEPYNAPSEQAIQREVEQ